MRRLWIASSTILFACATPSALRARAPIVGARATATIEYSASDEAGEQMVRHAFEASLGALELWGGLAEPIAIHVYPSHAQFLSAVRGLWANPLGRADSWLDAWATYDEVLMESPTAWSLLGASQREADELLLHELTHCAMYQHVGTRTSWRRKQIPIWFREGMASVTARQGYRWPSLEDVAVTWNAEPRLSPLEHADALLSAQHELVYGAAHHAFAFLLRQYEASTIRTLMQTMAAGATFPEAFDAVIGISPSQFAVDFRHYVKWRGFRGARLMGTR